MARKVVDAEWTEVKEEKAGDSGASSGANQPKNGLPKVIVATTRLKKPAGVVSVVQRRGPSGPATATAAAARCAVCGDRGATVEVGLFGLKTMVCKRCVAMGYGVARLAGLIFKK